MYNNELHIKSKNFLLIIVSSGLSRFGFSAFNLIAIWVILYLTRSPLLSGLADGTLSVPLFLSFIIGAYVDSFRDKKLLAILSGTFRALSLILILIGSLLNNLTLMVSGVYFAAFVIGFTSDIINSVRAYWTKEFLNETQYKSGTSISEMAFNLAEGFGYIVSGVLLSFGIVQAFAILLLFFIASLIPLNFIRIYVGKIQDKIDLAKNIKTGLHFVVKSRNVLEILIITLIGNLILNVAGILFIILIQIKYNLPAFYVSYVFGILVLGMFLGSITGRKTKGKLVNIIILAFMSIGVSLVSIYYVKNFYLIFLPAITIGLTTGIANVAASAAILKIVPQELMARVQGTINTFGVAGITVSGMIGGALTQFVGILNAFLILGSAFIVISPFLTFFKSLHGIII